MLNSFVKVVDGGLVGMLIICARNFGVVGNRCANMPLARHTSFLIRIEDFLCNRLHKIPAKLVDYEDGLKIRCSYSYILLFLIRENRSAKIIDSRVCCQ